MKVVVLREDTWIEDKLRVAGEVVVVPGDFPASDVKKVLQANAYTEQTPPDATAKAGVAK